MVIGIMFNCFLSDPVTKEKLSYYKQSSSQVAVICLPRKNVSRARQATNIEYGGSAVQIVCFDFVSNLRSLMLQQNYRVTKF